MRFPTSALVLICLWCFVLVPVKGADIVLCLKACGTPKEQTSEGTQLLKHLCGCVGDSTFDPFAFLDITTTAAPSSTTIRTTTITTTTAATTTKAPTIRAKQTVTTTTAAPVTSICDYLCAHQMGGDACRCSNPSLPGK